MSRPARRIPVSSVLIVLLVAGAALLLWRVGSRIANERAAAELAEVRTRAHETALEAADRLAEELEALRSAEASRPFHDYLLFTHDPRGAYVGRAIVPSSLADGPTNPLVDTYFQLDSCCRIAVPHRLARGASGAVDPRTGRELLKELAPFETWCQRGREWLIGLPSGGRLDLLGRESWLEIVQAERLDRELREGEGSARRGSGGERRVAIETGDLTWRMVTLADQQRIAALRRVTTPDGVWIQGFLLGESAIASMLGEGLVPLVIVDGEADDGVEIPLSGVEWRLAAEADELEQVARRDAEVVLATFRRGYLIALGFLALSGLALVAFVHQRARRRDERVRLSGWAAGELASPLRALHEAFDELGATNPELQRVHVALDQLDRVVDKLAGRSRPVANGASRFRRGNLGSVVRDAVERIEADLVEMGARIELQIPDGLPVVRFDAGAIRRIVQNLVENAEKYSRFCLDRSILIEVAIEGPEAVLIVSDRGPGLPEGVRSPLRRALGRAAGPLEGLSGFGMGLTMVDRLARAHRGRVVWEDRAGGGTRFAVYIPLDEGAPDDGREMRDAAEEAGFAAEAERPAGAALG